MRRGIWPVVVALLALWMAGGQAEARPTVVAKLTQPVSAGSPKGDPRLFVLQRNGLVRVISHGKVRRRPYLDLRGQVRLPFPRNQFRDQSGAFSLAFAPDYRRSGRLYVLYTNRDRRIHVDEFRRARGGPERANAKSRRTVLEIHQEGLDDLGGDLGFAPDGSLFISIGQGNSPDKAQDLGSLNGKLLRIDPRRSGGDPYSVPNDNPFVATPGARPEIYASGMRNPWRFTFSHRRLILSDVGEHRFEEVNVLGLDGAAGANLGWPIFEGPKRLAPGQGPFLGPVLTRRHGPRVCAIVGGVVVGGRYLYGDVCSGVVRSARLGRKRARADRSEGYLIPYLDSFAEDGRGRAYALSLFGRVYRLGPGR